MSVIYLLSSLPMPRFGVAAPMGIPEFLDACRAQLSRADAAACEALVTGGEVDHPFVRQWLDRVAVLRNAVAKARGAALGVESASWLRDTPDCDPTLERRANAAMQAANPIEKERALDAALWFASEELQGPDPLSKKAVFGYAIRLGLAHKWHGLSEAEGAGKFEKLTDVPIEL